MLQKRQPLQNGEKFLRVAVVGLCWRPSTSKENVSYIGPVDLGLRGLIVNRQICKISFFLIVEILLLVYSNILITTYL